MNEKTLNVYSIFPSIDGEVNLFGQGHPTTFLRLSQCNLSCSYCDTKYALKKESGKEMTIAEIISEIREIGLSKVTITGGEPLLQEDALFSLIVEMFHSLYIEEHLLKGVTIETNGTLAGKKLMCFHSFVLWVVDWKLDQAEKMNVDIFRNLDYNDWVKFVIVDSDDLKDAVEDMEALVRVGCRARFAVSPAHGQLDPRKLIKWVIEDRLDVTVNVQLHKYLKLDED